MSPLVAAHIAAEASLRALVARLVITAWYRLSGHDRADVPEWLAMVVPSILAAQRRSVLLTESFVARSVGRQPLGIDPEELIGPGLRNGAPPEQVYERPFVTLWSALKEGKPFEDASAKALERATSTASTDVQLAMTHTLRAAGEADALIVGFQRVPDEGACKFCRVVAGQRYKTYQLMPLHNLCGCGVDVITDANRHRFTGNPKNDLHITEGDLTVAIREHGELGPVLTDAADHFTQL